MKGRTRYCRESGTEDTEVFHPHDLIKDPYILETSSPDPLQIQSNILGEEVSNRDRREPDNKAKNFKYFWLEFTGLPEPPHFTESQLEQAFITRLQHFLLELATTQ